MGLLDDAIREHLELKRRHGADPGEVDRLQEEVFGPPRSAVDVPAEEPAEGAADALPDDADAPSGPGPFDAAPEVHEAVGVTAEEPERQVDAPAVEPIAPADEPWLDEPDEVPFGESLEHSDHRQRTTEYTAEDVAAATGTPPSDYVAPDEEAGEDLLEETPDFLQETPEHDRLWFEQKPPKDFDFGS